MKNKLKLSHLTLIIFILGAAHFVLLKTKAYGNNHWVDIPLHIIMGLFLGLIFLWRRNKLKNQEVINYRSLVTGLITFGFFGGLVWEIFEVIIWRSLPLIGNYVEIKQTALSDTFSDLTFDVLGSLIWLIFMKPVKSNEKN